MDMMGTMSVLLSSLLRMGSAIGTCNGLKYSGFVVGVCSCNGGEVPGAVVGAGLKQGDVQFCSRTEARPGVFCMLKSCIYVGPFL